MMQKIFLNEKQLILIGKDEQHLLPDSTNDFLRYSGADAKNFEDAISYLMSPDSKGVIIENDDFSALQKQLYITFKPIEAGGGVVHNQHGELLMIFRKGKWDLPKGKLDEGENIAACAQREVTEETGVTGLSLGEKICETYHAYILKKRWALKCATWFRMSTVDTSVLQPQIEEEIYEVRWVSHDDLLPLLQNSYAAIIEVLKVAGNI